MSVTPVQRLAVRVAGLSRSALQKLIKPAMEPISEISKLIKFYQTLTIVLTQQKAAASARFAPARCFGDGEWRNAVSGACR
jgi:hypothetical protein